MKLQKYCIAKNVEKRICELRETMTIEAIAKEMGVSQNTILRSLKSYGLTNSNIDAKMDAKIYKLYEETSAKKTAEKLNITLGKVYNAVKREKIRINK